MKARTEAKLVADPRLTAVVSARDRWSDALLVGAFALLVNLAGAGRPSLWFDEAATIAGSVRPVDEIFALLQHVDRVHGLYYLLMHGWFEIVPATEFWARVPSALFVAVAAAGVVVLGLQLSVRSVAIAAGTVFAVLPRTTWAGIEARPYGLAIAAAVWTTVLFVTVMRRDRRWLWIAYACTLFGSAVANVFVLLVVSVHAVVLWRTRPPRRLVIRWVAAVMGAVVALMPHLLAIKAQKGQVSWIWPVGPGTAGQILGDQYFPAVYSGRARALGPGGDVSAEQISAAIQAWTLVAPFIVVIIVLAVAALWMRRRSADVVGADRRLVAWTAGVWILVPTAAVITYSVVGTPLYQPHYLAFTAPAMALLIGLCVVTIGRRTQWIAAILMIVGVAALPNYLAQRGPYAKFGMDHSAVAELIASRAAPGDCLSIDETAAAALVEALTGGRPDAYAAVRDLGEENNALQRDSLFASRWPIAAWAGELASCSTLWTVTDRDDAVPVEEQGEQLAPGPRLEHVAAYRVPRERGFRIVGRWQFNMSQVVRMNGPATMVSERAQPVRG